MRRKQAMTTGCSVSGTDAGKRRRMTVVIRNVGAAAARSKQNPVGTVTGSCFAPAVIRPT